MKSYIKQDEMIKDLQGLINIKSVSGQPEGEYPFGKATFDALEYCLKLCEKFGFETKLCGNYMGYAQIGSGEKLMGVLVHVDVVPPGDGWDMEPYQATEKDGKLYGRGVIDDKGPAVATIYAMKDVLESGALSDKRVRLIFGCAEETGVWSDIEYYAQTEEIPSYGFTPDADFPVIYGEKGIVMLQLKMPVELSGLVSVSGGTAPNVVPDTCKVTFLNQGGSEVTVMKKGKAAHGSTPEAGVNAIGLAMEEAEGAFAEFYRKTIGMTVDGSRLNCNLKDEDSGEITVNPGMIQSDDTCICLTLDIRYPVTFTEEEVMERISKAVAPYGVTVEKIRGEKPVFTSKDSDFVKMLMEVYREVTGDDKAQPMTMGGGTYAKAAENIVAFGPVFPGRECTEHQANEYIFVEDLYMAREIYKNAILKA